MSLEDVGQCLYDEALSRNSMPEKDVFGRSSFNRYYYGAFLEARNLMQMMHPKWSRLSHADIPEALRKTVKQDFYNANKLAKRISDSATQKSCSHAILALRELADLLEQGYATRVVADYKTEVPVLFNGAREYSLNAVDVSKAKQWPAKARGYSGIIFLSWIQINANPR